jgi:hypothetical protein
MACIKRNHGSFSLIERYKDADGRWKTRTLAGLACYSTVADALAKMPGDIQWCKDELAEVRVVLKRNRFHRDYRHDEAYLERLLEVWTAQHEKLLAVLAERPDLDPRDPVLSIQSASETGEAETPLTPQSASEDPQ